MKAEDRGPDTEFADVTEEAQRLVAGLPSEPWGQTSCSVYETGRLVTLAPWLTGHRERLDYLLEAQRPDGGWGPPAGYALVPTLSATEALLTSLHGGGNGGVDPSGRVRLANAADRGLRLLLRLLPQLDGTTIPDTPAVDLIVAALVGSINEHLVRTADSPSADLGRWAGGGPLRLPKGLNGTRLAEVRAALDSGADPPEKLWHALEVVGEAARGARAVGRTALGVVGASPAATAAWLDGGGARDPRDPARRFLEAVVRRHGGPVPCGIPITVFERAWVLASLGRAGITVSVPAELLASLKQALDMGGASAGEGLPADADTTSAALYALGLLGIPFRPDSLWTFWADTHFCTWQGEDGFSVSVNAHALEAFGLYVADHPAAAPHYGDTSARLSALLQDHQREDGSWVDRWHASPYYATACCVLALDRFGGDAAAPAVRDAVRWVLATQRADGSWGRWEGTSEETAYAMQMLLSARSMPDGAKGGTVRDRATARGRRYLLRSAGSWNGPSLWHDKELYQPAAIVRAAILAALHLARPSTARLR